MEPDKKTPHNIVQTYAEDMVGALQNEKRESIKNIIQGEEAHEEERKNLSPESKKNKFFMIIGIFFLFLSIVVLYFLLSGRQAATVPVVKQNLPIIFSDKSSVIEVAELKKAQIEEKIITEVNATDVKKGGVDRISLTLNKAPVGLRKFIELINGTLVSPPGTLLSDDFFMGVVKGSGEVESKDFFILLKMRSIPDIFDPMRAWEAKMFSDLHGFFGVALTPETKYLITANFEDGIMQNKNARILYDTNRKVVMMYVFADDNSIIITNTQNAVREIMLRLASSQVSK